MSNNTKVTKAVIPCAGLGTRFLPITKSLPKELLPVIDKPILQYILDEATQSGIVDVLLVINQSKMAIKNYFSPDFALVSKLQDVGKVKEAELIQQLNNKVNIVFEYQEKPKGSGDAVLYAKKFVGNSPFALAWGDDLMAAKEPVMGQLAVAYEQFGTTIVGVQQILNDDIVKYGVPAVSQQQGRNYQCTEIVEKPPLDKIPSRLASLGRYILHNEIFDEIINSANQNKHNELHLTTALNSLASKGRLWAYDFEGLRFDMGDKLGSCKAIVHFALQRYGDDFKQYLKELI
ncbi:MAG: UTP--glucose-1-phosphate uridylyltransferase [Firmicutes bacterium]|nr:UTP--glucose-1-phosphate uridylyltransferase [Bacillota bacterium]MCL1953427.1 UTP--glucose-1-phosphate uridylyltransferase [Bacillota bacterium]